MDPNGFERLTEREREVLRLVHGGLRSKEIALRLELSPFTVDDHVKSARRTLAVTSRHAAAVALAEWESQSPKWGALTEDLPDQLYTAPEGGAASTLGERHIDFQFAEVEVAPTGSQVPELGSYLRDLSPPSRLFAVAVASMTLVVLTTGMVMILRETGPLLVRLAEPLYHLI